MAILTRLPGPFLRFIMWIQRSLDAWNLLPSALTESDPLYASLFLPTSIDRARQRPSPLV